MNVTMIGDRSRFGIEFEIDADLLGDPEYSRWCFGRLRFWCGSMPIGAWEEVTALCSIAAHARSVSNEVGQRAGHGLCALDARSVAATISSALYEDHGQDDRVVAADARRYSPLVVSPSVDVFDSWRIILIECDMAARLIWYRLDDMNISECLLGKGEHEAVLRDFASYVEVAIANAMQS